MAKVKRLNMTKWKDIVSGRGTAAEFVTVPATMPGVTFRGVYTDNTKTEVAVAWPVDRPEQGQIDFANEHCFGGVPVDEISREVDRKGLHLVRNEQ